LRPSWNAWLLTRGAANVMALTGTPRCIARGEQRQRAAEAVPSHRHAHHLAEVAAEVAHQPHEPPGDLFPHAALAELASGPRRHVV
jgi:hypothetical protein